MNVVFISLKSVYIFCFIYMYFQEFQAFPLLYVIYEDLILDLLDRLVPKNVRCHAYETLTVRCDSLNMGRINWPLINTYAYTSSIVYKSSFFLVIRHKWAPNTRHYRQLHGQTTQHDTGLHAGPPGPHLHSQGRDWPPKYRLVSHITSENLMTSACHRIECGHLHVIDQSHCYGSQNNSVRYIDILICCLYPCCVYLTKRETSPLSVKVCNF